jgi:hypothetical protein
MFFTRSQIAGTTLVVPAGSLAGAVGGIHALAIDSISTARETATAGWQAVVDDAIHTSNADERMFLMTA